MNFFHSKFSPENKRESILSRGALQEAPVGLLSSGDNFGKLLVQVAYGIRRVCHEPIIYRPSSGAMPI